MTLFAMVSLLQFVLSRMQNRIELVGEQDATQARLM